MRLLNPFNPQHPSMVKTFVGRRKELRRLESSLRHTKLGRPVHFMITGERGIGKTSLLNYVSSMAHGLGDSGDERLDFIVAPVQVESTTTQLEFVHKVELALRRELQRTESARQFLGKAWAFVQRLEIVGVGLKEIQRDVNAQMLLWEEFANSLAETARRTCVTGDPDALYGNRTYDGILILIDEVDTANEAFGIGAFLKYLTEYFQRTNCHHVMFGLSGLPTIVEVLLKSHRSALRVFDEISLPMLSRSDVDELIETYLLGANPNHCTFSMSREAKTLVWSLAEGHPHFIQQVCYSAFTAAEHRIIEAIEHSSSRRLPPNIEIEIADVNEGAFSARGALAVIGDIYYSNLVGAELRDVQCREVLAVLSEYLDAGVTIKEVANRVGIGAARTSDILAGLIEKGLIQRGDEKDLYRVRHHCFAYWLQSSGRARPILVEAEPAAGSLRS